ncbi:MAG: DUF2934 domain-containing protein [Methylovulum sp.]|nr:DUF2934 domain-containing protein [Methylovulum sp.]
MDKDVNNEKKTVRDKVIHLPGYDAKIAEIAYYKAEKRGFAPGHELEDWHIAQQEFLGFE